MRRRSALLTTTALFGGLALATVVAAAPAAADAAVTSAGPLTSIVTTDLLNCAVTHTGDLQGEWFDNTACGTFVAVGNQMFGPAFVPAGSSVTGSTGYQAFTSISPAVASGSGTASDPYTIRTTVALGTTGLQLTQTDAYEVGQESYRTSVALSGAAADVVVYRAGDCYLQDSDEGLGDVQNGNAPVCKALPTSANPDRIEALYPLTTGSSYLEDGYSAVWAAIATRQTLPNTCRCADAIDNGIALSWPVTVPAAGSTTVDSLTVFSPLGASPVAFGKTADTPTVAAGGADGYTVTVTNPGVIAQTLQSITDTLPAGFSYVAGSSTGATTADPTVSGSDLTWNGAFVVPAGTSAGPGTVTLHFGVTAGTTAGTYTNSVTGTGRGVTVVGATDVAPVTVTAAPTSPTPTPPTTSPTPTRTRSGPVVPLADTGADVGPLAALAAGLLGVGGLTLALVRRRGAQH